MERYLKENEVYFAVVGTGHMVSENGIINLLVQKEYKVRQL